MNMKLTLPILCLSFAINIPSTHADSAAINNLKTVQHLASVAATIPAAINFVSPTQNKDLKKVDKLATLTYGLMTSALEQGLPYMAVVKMMNAISQARFNADPSESEIQAVLLKAIETACTISTKGTTARIIAKKISSEEKRILRRLVRCLIFSAEEALIKATVNTIDDTLKKSFDALNITNKFMCDLCTLLLINAGGELAGEMLISSAEDKQPGDALKALYNDLKESFALHKTRNFVFAESEAE